VKNGLAEARTQTGGQRDALNHT